MLSLKRVSTFSALFLVITGATYSRSDPGRTRDRDLVPDEQVAAQIADAVLVPIYGKEVLKQKPYKISLRDGQWIVDGVIHTKPGEVILGGVAHLEIRKKDGAIQNVIHGK